MLNRRALLATSLAAPLAAPAFAQSIPSGTIRLVVPYNPGGITDVLARAISGPMGAALGHTMVVENRAGANGTIGSMVVVRAPADGLTLLLGVTDTHAVNPTAMRTVPYDTQRDFTPISNITNVPLVLAVGPTMRGVADLPAFIARAKAQPGNLTHSSWGIGSVSHIAMLRLAGATGTDFLHVPFTGAAPAIQALAASQVDSMVVPAGAAAAMAGENGVRVLAALSAQRLGLLPNVPTLMEQGIDLTTSIFQAVFAPPRTPAPIVAQLNAAVAAGLAAPAMQEVLRGQAALPDHTTSEGLSQRVLAEQAAWGAIIRSANIRLD